MVIPEESMITLSNCDAQIYEITVESISVNITLNVYGTYICSSMCSTIIYI